MRKYLKIFVVSIAFFALLSPILFGLLCATIDEIFAAPAYEALIDSGDFTLVDTGFCQNENLDQMSSNACALISSPNVDKKYLLGTIGVHANLKKEIVIDAFGVNKTDGLLDKLFVYSMPSVYEVYSENINQKILKNEEYSLFNIYSNYKRLSMRLTTATYFPVFSRNVLAIKNSRQIILVFNEKDSLIVDKIEDNREELFLFEPLNE